jgi:hypothetical protein
MSLNTTVAKNFSASGLFLGDGDAAALAGAVLRRWPHLASVPDVAHLPAAVFIRGFLSGDARAFIEQGAAALAVFDPEIEGIIVGHRSACLKEGVPAADAEGLIRAYRAMGIHAGEVQRHGLETQSGTHASGQNFAVIAVARSAVDLDVAIATQQASLDGSSEARVRMGLLLGYPICCIHAFLSETARGDNLDNERQPFLRAPLAKLHPLLHRLGLPRLVSHHLCSPDCAYSIRGAEATMELMRARGPSGAAWVLRELARPALFLDYARRARLTGEWQGEKFILQAFQPIGDGTWSQSDEPLVSISLDSQGVHLYGPQFDNWFGATRPLLTTPHATLGPPALKAIQPKGLPSGPAPPTFLGHALPLPLTDGWQVAAVRPGREQNLEVVLQHGAAGELTAFLAPLAPGRRHFRSTRLLGLSYRPDSRMPSSQIEAAMSRFAAVLASLETEALVKQAFEPLMVSSPQ